MVSPPRAEPCSFMEKRYKLRLVILTHSKLPHNVVSQRGRERINEQIDVLKGLLPVDQTPRSKAQVLESTIAYAKVVSLFTLSSHIQRMQQDTEDTQYEYTAACEENVRLTQMYKLLASNKVCYSLSGAKTYVPSPLRKSNAHHPTRMREVGSSFSRLGRHINIQLHSSVLIFSAKNFCLVCCWAAGRSSLPRAKARSCPLEKNRFS
jgi:hypothetical protein